MAGGVGVWADLAGAGLLTRHDAAALEAAERVGNLPWALRALADGGDRRSHYRLLALGQVLQPLAILGLGGLVLVICLAYFGPLVAMIELLGDENF